MNSQTTTDECLKNIPQRLLGPPCETELLLDNKCYTTLLDSESTVSAINESCFRQLDLPLYLLKDLLHVACANGDTLPYTGYVILEIGIPQSQETLTALCLVAPDTEYNQRVPVLLGTNVLGSLRQKFGTDLRGTAWK